ncbi:MAG: sigma-54 interaction domain-containing protein [Marinilabiliaceae bacterium]
MADNSEIKARFGIIGNDPEFLRAIDMAVQVAPIQLSVLIIGESGAGKEVFPQIIHAFSARKHKPYVAVNCGAIPEGTIDSELFGHEKGAFTGALNERKGYFEEANGGTIFLDEIGELPLATQAKLLRVLEKGEYMRVGSSLVKKTDVRVVAATNVDLEKAIVSGRFREDLFYRLNGVLIRIPPLRKRKSDIPQLFHKFTSDFADKNHIPPVRLTPEAVDELTAYNWPGNVRQLKNVAEQLTVLAPERLVSRDDMARFIPTAEPADRARLLPQVDGQRDQAFSSDREILYKILFDLRNDVNDLKKLVLSLINSEGGVESLSKENLNILRRVYASNDEPGIATRDNAHPDEASLLPSQHRSLAQGSLGGQVEDILPVRPAETADAHVVEEARPLSIADNEKELIRKSLVKNKGSRRITARELQISERTLYRKIHDYGLDDL